MASIESIPQAERSYVEIGKSEDKLSMTVYPRVHMFSFDLSLFQGNMSSGSMGFSLFNQPTVITVERSNVDQILGVSSEMKDQINRHLYLLRERLGEQSPCDCLKFTIEIPSRFRHHTGLGLTTQIIGGALIAAARVYGKIISPKDLFNIGVGQVSALGVNLIYTPGFIMEFGYKVDNEGKISAHPDLYDYTESPSGAVLAIRDLSWQAVVAVPKKIVSLSGKIEDDFWSNIYPDKIESSRYISYAVLNYIMPALISNDFDMFVKGLTLATSAGTKPAEESIQNPETKFMLKAMRRTFGFAAISSLGPAIFSFVRKGDFDKLARNIDSKNFDLFCIDINQSQSYGCSIRLDLPSDVVKNNQQKNFFEDSNIPYETLDHDNIDRLKREIKSKVGKKHSKIIASFACLGKTHFAYRHPDIAVDLESLPYRYKSSNVSEEAKASADLEYNDAFPRNYVEKIVSVLGDYDYIFVVLSIPALKMLDDLGLAYTILYPDQSMADTIIERAKKRGNNQSMINLLHDNLSSRRELELMNKILTCSNYIYLKDDQYIEDLVKRGEI